MNPAYTFRITPFEVKAPPDRVEIKIPFVPNFEKNGSIFALSAVSALALAGSTRFLVSAPAAGSMAKRVAKVREGALTEAKREALPSRDFAVPSERKYPIHDREHGRLALTFVAAPSNKAYRYRVLSRVFSRYPELVNFWAETKPGLKNPLSVEFLQNQILEYRSKMEEMKGSERMAIEEEISSMQALTRAAAFIRRRSARRVA